MTRVIEVNDVNEQSSILLNIDMIIMIRTSVHVENANSEIKLSNSSIFVTETIVEIKRMCNL